MLTAWRRVFTPFQVAQLTVQTYPNNADILAMIKCAGVRLQSGSSAVDTRARPVKLKTVIVLSSTCVQLARSDGSSLQWE